MRIFYIIFLFIFGMISQVEAQKRMPQLSDLYKVQDVDEPDFSPDGTQIVYTVSQMHADSNQTSTNLWLVSLDNKRSKQLTFSKNSNNDSPKWSPDGKWIAYLSDAGGESTQIWLYSVKKAKKMQLTQLNKEISDFSWSPDSSSIAFIGKEQQKDDKNKEPIVINRYDFKDDSEGYLTDRREHLYLFHIKTKKVLRLTSGAHDESTPSWSPDGRYIAYVSKRGLEPGRNANYDVFLIQPQPFAAEQQLTYYQGSDMSPDLESELAWSPDSSQIAYLRTQGGKWYYYAPSQLAVITLANKQERLVNPIDRAFYKPQWSDDGKTIYALVEENRNTYLNQINYKTGLMRQLTHGKRYDQNFTIKKDKVVVLSSDFQHPSELYLLGKGERVLTHHNAPLINKVQFQAAEDFSFRNSDGIMIDGLLVKPAQYVKGQRSPALLYLHGGPVDQHSHDFDFELQWLAANGYAVIAPNPRGSSGKGLAFSKAIYADWGHLDVHDVLESVDYLVGEGIIDPKRLAVGGWSYGGMLTDYVIASDTRFKAALSGAGSSNILSNYGVDQYTYDYEQELGQPWKNPNAYLKLSYPFMKSNQIKTPTLFMCGELDFNVPCEGSQQLYQALKSLHVPTQLIIYPEEHHNLSSPRYLADRLTRYISWLNYYVK